MDVEFFNSLEEATDRLQQVMKAADSRVKPWQASISSGDCFISETEDGLLVFGEVLETYKEQHLQNYRFCRCYSVACQEGELGDVHVSTILCLISRGLFEQLRQEGWEVRTRPGVFEQWMSDKCPCLEVYFLQGPQKPHRRAPRHGNLCSFYSETTL